MDIKTAKSIIEAAMRPGYPMDDGSGWHSEGRHRAHAGRELGITEVPVIDFRGPAKVTEGLDTLAPWRWTRRSRIEWEAGFEIGSTHYEVSIFDANQGIWDLNFSASPGGDPMNGTQRVTGTGNGRTVYATVLAIFVDFEDAMGPNLRGFKIESDTTERSRHRVNQHIARLLQQRFQGEYEIQDDAENGEILMMKVRESTLR